VQLFFYQPHHPIATGFYNSSPSSRIFVHLEIAHLHHLFPVTPALNITDLNGSCVSIPSGLQSLLLAFSESEFLNRWEEEFKALTKNKKK
jgi:hypothetical protein